MVRASYRVRIASQLWSILKQERKYIIRRTSVGYLRQSALALSTRSGGRVPELGTLGSVRGEVRGLLEKGLGYTVA
jgi:hypothetical protein